MITIAGAVAIEAIETQTLDQPSPEHRAAGVASVAAHYGDPMREQRTLDTAVGLVDRSHRGVIAIPGVDRAGWLHSITTQHLAVLSTDQGTELLVLSPNGHVEHAAQLLDDGETTWLDTEPGRTADLLAFLQKMVFMTRVAPRDATAEMAVLSLVGPDVDKALAVLDIPPLAEPTIAEVPGPKFASASVAKSATSAYPVVAVPGGGFARRGRLGVDLLVPRGQVAELAERLATAGVPAAGLWAYEALLVAARLPRVGWETDHRTIPAEVELTGPAVHLDKGCYRGQETIARVHNLGRPPRRLVLLHLDGIATDQPPASQTPVTTVEGRTIGFVGTAVRHYELGQIALAVIKRNTPDDAELRVGEQAASIDAA